MYSMLCKLLSVVQRDLFVNNAVKSCKNAGGKKMCGFIQRVTDSPAVIALLEQIGLGDVVPSFQQEKEGILNFYPAFGKKS